MTRPSEKHLDDAELDALVSSPDRVTGSGPISEPILSEAQCHVESCKDCNRKVQMHKHAQGELHGLESSRPVQPGPGCPKEEADWLHMATGLLPKAKARELMNHAAQCDHCGPLLRKAADIVADEATPAEERTLAGLASVQPGWQRDLAEKLRGDMPPRQPDGARAPRWGGFISWPRPAIAAAALAIVMVAGWLGLRLLRPPSAEQLLAQAYTEHRTLEVRIPGAKYAPMRVERSAGGSNLDKSASLLKAEALIGENLRRNPDDPTWLQARARADLLDGNYESAIRSLQRALETEPDSPSLLTDLASAYFERAESADRAIDYGNAIESLGKALAKSPDDPVALFNRALACERMFLYTQAVDDWEHYLRVDPQGEWTDDARKRLAALKEKLKQHEQSLEQPLLGTSEFAVNVDRFDQSTWAHVDVRIEEYLDAAIQVWLPVAFSAKTGKTSPQERAAATKALVALAEILSVQHNDRWLADLLNSDETEAMGAGAEALGRSVGANVAGSPSAGLTASIEAERFFHEAGSGPGLLRAQMEELYSLHRLFHSSECLRLASSTKTALKQKRYSWMASQVRLEEFSCLDSQAKMDMGHRALAEALNLAEGSGYAALFLRGMAFAAILDTDKGNLADAAAWDRAGLSKYWSSLTPPLRAYQFYDDLTDQAQRSGRWQLAISAGRDAVGAIAATPNRSGEGMAHFELAISLGAANKLAEKAQQYAIALNIFSSLPSDPGIRGFEADAEMQLAEAEASQGRTDEAESRLRKAKADLPSDLDSFGTWLTYYRTQARIAQQRGDAKSQQRACNAVVTIGEWGLSTIRTERDRLTWNHATANCYRELVSAKLTENDPVTALSIWEWYQGAAARSMHAVPAGATPFAAFDQQPPSANFAAVQQQLQQLDHETVLAYAELGERVSAWIYDNRGVHWENIAIDRRTLTRVTSEFAIQCADPNSDMNALLQNGRLLYGWLVAPFEGRLDPNRTLIVEADGSLASLPFQALVEPDGSYLGLHRALVSSPGLNYMLRLRRGGPLSPTLPALVVGNPAVSSTSQSTPLPDADREAQEISRLFKNPVLLEAKQANQTAILDHLAKAAIFHFAGHAVSGPEGTGLEVAPDAESNGIAPRMLISPDNIAAAHLHDLELAVLSACSTGRAGDEGLADPEDIAEAFLREGVPHVIASRWNVDSASTAALMSLTYQELLRGESVTGSLQWASRQIATIPATSHPYYWAAFNVFGRA